MLTNKTWSSPHCEIISTCANRQGDRWFPCHLKLWMMLGTNLFSLPKTTMTSAQMPLVDFCITHPQKRWRLPFKPKMGLNEVGGWPVAKKGLIQINPTDCRPSLRSMAYSISKMALPTAWTAQRIYPRTIAPHQESAQPTVQTTLVADQAASEMVGEPIALGIRGAAAAAMDVAAVAVAAVAVAAAVVEVDAGAVVAEAVAEVKC
jgi:hypothetical protein